jgi:transposase-like protein
MRYTAEQIQVAIHEWQASGLSRKAFCVQHDICPQTFYNWLKRINQSPTSGFTEVRLPLRERVEGCEIIFPSGARMIFGDEPTASWLREVLR